MKSEKYGHLRSLSEYRSSIISNPPLKNLFFELTLRCNEHCLHCGSHCGDIESTELSFEQYKKIMDDVKNDFGTETLMLKITGGEPLLRKDFFEIMGYAHKLGFKWGMTTNGTLIDDTVAKKLTECGMRTVSISIDGTEKSHDFIRGRKGAFKAAMDGVNALIRSGLKYVHITTVINHFNIQDLPQMFEIFKDMDIATWRVINIEPIGRANDHPELMLDKDEYIRMFNFIRDKRLEGYPVTYGCSHFLGMDYERQVRNWYFLCNAGLYTASIMANGDIGACLNIERRPELIQGNILKDNLKDVWNNKFKAFRTDLSERNEKCKKCDENIFCHGGAHHSWDYENNSPLICFKDILF